MDLFQETVTKCTIDPVESLDDELSDIYVLEHHIPLLLQIELSRKVPRRAFQRQKQRGTSHILTIYPQSACVAQ
jgi:hypothetical protein